MMNGVTTLSRPQASEMEDSRGALCRNRRLFGTLERLRCGWARQNREGGEGRERAGSSCLFVQRTWRSRVSGKAVAELRQRGYDARALVGGITAWHAIGGTTVPLDTSTYEEAP